MFDYVKLIQVARARACAYQLYMHIRMRITYILLEEIFFLLPHEYQLQDMKIKKEKE